MRPDALAKLRGDLVYLAARVPPGCLTGAILRSPHPHARMLAIDTSAAAALPGVRAIVTAADLPPGLLMGIRVKDQPILAQDVVRYVGEPILGIAADTPELARAALALVRIDYAMLPMVTDPVAALQADAPPVHPGGNLCHTTAFDRGDLDVAFARSAHVVETVIETPRQMHAALELEGGVAVPDGDTLAVFAPAQDPHGVRAELAHILGWPDARVEVIGSPIGGGYGGKEDMHVQPVLAMLAAKCGRPVRIVLSRPESVIATVKRHVFRIRMRTGCDAEGRLTAHDVDALADNGAYASHGPEVLDTAHEAAQGPYVYEAVRLRGRLVYTNTGVGGAFRGFGGTQMLTALELQIDTLASAAGIDPVAFRQRNLRGPRDAGPLGQKMAPQPELAEVAHRLFAHPARLRAVSDGRFRRGVGAALVMKGEGFAGGGPNGALGVLALAADGAIELRTGIVEMGQGAEWATLAALARALGVAQGDCRAVLGDTRLAPSGGPTSASRGTQVLVRLARAGGPGLTSRLIGAAATALGEDPAALHLGPGGVHRVGDRRNAPLLGFRDLAARAGVVEQPVSIPGIETTVPGQAVHTIFSTCAAIARVAVDRCTGLVRAERIVLIPGCGPVLIADSFRGQMEGSAAMGLGFALMEDLTARDGRFLASNLDRYLVPTIRDVPPIEIEPVETLDPDDPAGIRGAGEIGVNAVAPAIVNAIRDALGGASPPRVPCDPAWILSVLDTLP